MYLEISEHKLSTNLVICMVCDDPRKVQNITVNWWAINGTTLSINNDAIVLIVLLPVQQNTNILAMCIFLCSLVVHYYNIPIGNFKGRDKLSY